MEELIEYAVLYYYWAMSYVYKFLGIEIIQNKNQLNEELQTKYSNL